MARPLLDTHTRPLTHLPCEATLAYITAAVGWLWRQLDIDVVVML